MPKKKFLITTPIFYVNNVPHLGHLYTTIVADVVQRFHRLLDEKKQIIFSTGTDEHGLKVQQAAISAKTDPLSFCNQVSQKYKNVFDLYDIQYSDFIRTSEPRHERCVNHFFSSINSRGYFYKGEYKGWYSVSDELFLTDKEVEKISLPNGEVNVTSKESGHPVEWTSELNYLFKLSKFQNDLLHWLKKDGRVTPSRFQDELRGWISNGLIDLSVSRPVNRVSWGIPFPLDKQQTIYVWLDALTNYLTVAGYPHNSQWPPDVQIIGKDILRFHGIYWPALLMAADLEPPEKIVVHSHWQVDGKKMSKSLGNVVCPVTLLNRFNADAVRYFLLRSATFHSDGAWNEMRAVYCANADLANALGNLLSRCVAPSLNPEQRIPSFSEHILGTASSTYNSLLDQLKRLPDEVESHFRNYRFNEGIDAVMMMVHSTNSLIDEEKPWELKKLPDRSKLESVLYIAMVAVRAAAISLQPIVPSYAGTVLNILNIPESERYWNSLKKDISLVFTSSHLGPRSIPFKKIKL